MLSRWFPRDLVKPLIKKADFLDVILYSREQVLAECAEMKNDVTICESDVRRANSVLCIVSESFL